MPIQKGKRRKRPRSRGISQAHPVEPVTRPAPAAKVSERPVRKRWRPPLVINVVFGIAMVVFGVLFFAWNKGIGVQERVLLLLAYLVVASIYLGKAFRQYRSSRQP